MQLKHLNWLFASLAFLVSSSSLFGTAHAFHLRIDCHRSGIPASWSGTTSEVEFWVEIDASWHRLAKFVPGPSLCDSEDEISIYGWLGTNPSEVDTVWITGGDELFWIDQVKLMRDDNSTYATKGSDGDTLGWCITYDENQDHTRCINHPPQQGLDWSF